MKKQNLSLFKDFSKYKNKLLKSVLFLYLVLIVVVTNLVTLFQKNDNESIVLFVIISTCTYFAFDKKNLVVALLTPLIIVNLLLFIRKRFSRKKLEGYSDDLLTRNERNEIWKSFTADEDCNFYDESEGKDAPKPFRKCILNALDIIGLDDLLLIESTDDTNNGEFDNDRVYKIRENGKRSNRKKLR